MNAPARESRSPTISLRVPTQRRELIDRAAEEALLDRRVFHLDAAQYEAFERALDAPPRPSAALRKLLAQPAPWER